MNKARFFIILLVLILVPSLGLADGSKGNEKNILLDNNAAKEQSLLPEGALTDTSLGAEINTLWESEVAHEDLARVMNFITNNIGSQVSLGGEQHTITGKEALDVVVYLLLCCDEKELNESIAAFGKITRIKFPVFYVAVPADKMQGLGEIGEIQEITLTKEARALWMEAIGQ